MMRKLLFICLFVPLVADATCYLRESTASQTILFGPFLDGTDGRTPETAITVANTDIRISKAGGNTAAKNSGGGTHDESGWYQITLDATDTDTVGTLQIYTDESVNATDIVPVWLTCQVLEQNYYDLIDGTTAVLTAADTGLVEGSTTINGAPTSQTEFVITDGATNDDAYNDHVICFIGGTEKDCSQVSDYTGSSKTVFLDAAPEFTIASGDTVRIFHPGQTDLLMEIRDDTNELQGDDYPASFTSVLADTAEIGVAGAGLTDIPGLADMTFIDTTISTATSQTELVLTAGSADDDAYNGCVALIRDVSTSTQMARAPIIDYTGSTTTIKLSYDPGVFTMAATDFVTVVCGPVMR